ncbi:hypothetical protein [Haloglomus litoreum]|uniref:hypothetical protein n=1 Tax=Haloglomus litoreum TaxID=3034026 RepID=UPI0023E8807E|nr:hypothetical protein [Haloglomus sp. DT116]
MDTKHSLVGSPATALVGDMASQVQRAGHEIRYDSETEADVEMAERFVEPIGPRCEHEGGAVPLISSQRTRTDPQTIAS